MKVCIDLETVPTQSVEGIEILKANIEQAKEKLSPPGNYGTEAAEKWLIKKRLELDTGFEQAHLKTSFDGALGEIITIGFKVGNGKTKAIHRQTGANNPKGETSIIERAFQLIGEELELKGGTLDKIQWIGHNVIKFGLPFLYKRCVINNIKPLFDIPNNARHGYNAYDTMQAWAGYGGTVSQDNLCKLLGLATKQGMDGSKIYGAWCNGQDDEIIKYCKADVNTVYDLYDRLNFL